jgi:hypothetical protein
LLADFAGVTLAVLLALQAVRRARLEGGFDIDFSLTDGAVFLGNAVRDRSVRIGREQVQKAIEELGKGRIFDALEGAEYCKSDTKGGLPLAPFSMGKL